MPVSAETLSKLMDAGLSGDALIDVVASIDADMAVNPAPADEAAERRRAKDRERKRAKKAENSAEFRGNSAESPSPKENTPTPPKENTPPQKKNPPKGGQKEKGSPLDASQAVEVWNEVCAPAGMPKCLKLTDRRSKQIGARIAEHGEKSWREACQRLARSAFCRGENDNGWAATIDFLSTPDGFVKVMEGKYDNRDKPSAEQVRRDIWRERIAEAPSGSVSPHPRPRLAFAGPGSGDPAPGGTCTPDAGSDRGGRGNAPDDLWGRQAR